MNSIMMPAMKMIERMIIIGRLIGIWISGSFLFRVLALALFAISSMRMPVIPPEMTPPIPRMKVNLMNSNWVSIR